MEALGQGAAATGSKQMSRVIVRDDEQHAGEMNEAFSEMENENRFSSNTTFTRTTARYFRDPKGGKIH